MLLESTSLGAEVGIYTGCFLVTLAIFLGIFLTMMHSNSHKFWLVALILFFALIIFAIGFPIYRLVEAIKASDKSQFTMISIHMASCVVLSPLLSLLLIIGYVYMPSVFIKLVDG